MRIRATICELWREGYSYSENMPRKTVVVTVSDNASDTAIARAIFLALSVTNCGFRRDQWCCSDFGPWRNGLTGIYADIMEDWTA